MSATPIDHKKLLKHLYVASARPGLVDVPPLNYLMVDGQGDPNTAGAYATAVRALFAVAYGLKFALRAAGAADFTVMPLEGLWWAPDMAAFHTLDKGAWRWTMMIMQPASVTADLVERVRAAVSVTVPPGLRLERLAEGRAAQIRHIGPYAAEGPTIERLHSFIAARGLRLTGKHHEIYLGDPRRAAPERLRTVLRQPVS